MKRIARALAEFFALSIPLTWLWLEWGSGAYLRLLVAISRGVHGALGLAFDTHGLAGLSLRYVGHVPFLALVLVTPGLSWRRRLWGWGIGAAVLVLAHLGLMAFGSATFGDTSRTIGAIMPVILLNDALPLLLWMVVAREFLRSLVPGLGEGRRPDPGGGG